MVEVAVCLDNLYTAMGYSDAHYASWDATNGECSRLIETKQASRRRDDMTWVDRDISRRGRWERQKDSHCE